MPEDRIGLLNDAYALTKSGYMENVGMFFKLLGGFHSEENPNVWMAVVNLVSPTGLLQSIFQDEMENVYGQYKRFIREVLIEGPWKKLGWDHKPEDSDLVREMRGRLVTAAALYLDGDVAE